jgi:hypothetical protein
MKVLAGFAAVVLVVLGARALKGRGGHSPGPVEPPPEPTDLIPTGSDVPV